MASPIAVLCVVLITNVFVAMLSGADDFEERFPIFNPPGKEDAEVVEADVPPENQTLIQQAWGFIKGIFTTAGEAIRDVASTTWLVLRSVWGVVEMLVDSMTLNITVGGQAPPAWLRVMYAVPMSAATAWSIAKLLMRSSS